MAGKNTPNYYMHLRGAFNLINTLHRLSQLQKRATKRYLYVCSRSADLLIQIRFLKDCRKHGLIPKGIRNYVRIPSGVVDRNTIDALDRLRKKVLKSIINDKFRHLHSFDMDKVALFPIINCLPDSIGGYVRYLKETLVTTTLRNAVHRLQNKMVALRNKEKFLRQGESPILVEVKPDEMPKGAMDLLSRGPKFIPVPTVAEEMKMEVKAAVLKVANQCTRSLRTLDPTSETSSSQQAEEGIPSLISPFPKVEFMQPSLTLPPKQAALVNEVEKLLTRSTQAKSNLTTVERAAMAELSKSKNLVVIPMDKTGKFAVMKRSFYNERMKVNFGFGGRFRPIPVLGKGRDYIEKVTKEANELWKSVCSKRNLPREISRMCGSHHCSIPQSRGLAKDHKSGFPMCNMRMVQPNTNAPVQKIDWLMSRILGQLTDFIPSYVKSSAEFMEKVGDLVVPEGSFQFSLDVVDLYPSVPIGAALKVIKEELLVHWRDIITFGLEAQDVIMLLEFSLKHSITSFGNYSYLQKGGVAIGSHCGRIVADLLLKDIESKVMTHFSSLCLVYLRYVDDAFGIWTGSSVQLFRMIDEFNSIYPGVQFTWETQNEMAMLNFLDVTCCLENQKVTFKIYRKPTATDCYLANDSHISSTVKAALVYGEATRMRRNCSTESSQNEALELMRQRFLKSGFNNEFVLKHMQVRRKARPRMADEFRFYLKIPFFSDSFTAQMRRIIKRLELPVKLVVYFTPSLSVLLKPKMKTPKECACSICQLGIKCGEKTLVYQLTCSMCGATYIGQTYRPWRERCKEHMGAVQSASLHSAMADHLEIDHPGREEKWPVMSTKIANARKDLLLSTETLYIKERNPTLNKKLPTMFL